MKRIAIALTLLVVLGAFAGVAYRQFSKPSTPAEAFTEASKQQIRFQEKIDLERIADEPDIATIEGYEIRIRSLWTNLIEAWPDSEEADRARLRLLERDVAQEPDAKAKVDLIDAFLAERPEHAAKKDLLWKKAELMRDELKDPLGAIAVFGEIETHYPDDPIAPKAALASARIYDEIQEHGAAARSYARIAEKYPTSPEAEQAQMRRAALLEEKLDQKREAAELYRQVAARNPGGAAGREARRRSDELFGELEQDDQAQYYQDTYKLEERDLYRISKEEFNSPTRKKIRAQGFDVEHYAMDLSLDPENSMMELTALVRGELRDELDQPLILELNPGLDVERIDLVAGGEEERASLKFSKRGPYVEMILPPLKGEPPYVLELEFEISGQVGQWLGDSLTAEGGSLRTESRWFPSGYIGDTATKRIAIECPDPYVALAQGFPEDAEDSEKEGWTRRVYVQDRPTPFATIAIGKFIELTETGPDDLPIVLYLHEANAEAGEGIIASAKKAIEVYENIFGAFPYRRLAIAEVPAFPGGYGAASLILLGSVAFTGDETPEKFIAHEIAHQWWGNLVSVDLQEGSIPWLSESFATYLDAVFTERTQGEAAFRNQIRTMANFYRENAVQFEDRPIAETLWLNSMYHSLMYEKGALVLHSLRRELGDEAFFNLLRDFVERHRNETVNVDQFAAAAGEAAGEPMDWFFDQALNRTGYAHLTIEEATGHRSETGWSIDLHVTQPEDAVYRMTLDVEITTEGGDAEIVEAEIVSASDRVTLTCIGRPTRVRLDPENWHLIDARRELIEAQVTFDTPAVSADEAMRLPREEL